MTVLAGPLFALSTCRTSLLQAQRMHAARVRQAALAEHCHAGGLQAAEGLPAADLSAVAAGLHALAAAGVADLGDIVAATLLPEVAALQVGGLRGLGWDYGPVGAARGDVPVDVAIVDEAGCLPDYAMPALLAFMPSNLVRPWHTLCTPHGSLHVTCMHLHVRTRVHTPSPCLSAHTEPSPSDPCAAATAAVVLQVLVGDPKQLQASSEFFNTHVPRRQGGLREDMQHHSRSTMERLSRAGRSVFAPGGSHSSMLTTQYRMHPDVCTVVSEHFYRCAPLRTPVSCDVTAVPAPRCGDA